MISDKLSLNVYTSDTLLSLLFAPFTEAESVAPCLQAMLSACCKKKQKTNVAQAAVRFKGPLLLLNMTIRICVAFFILTSGIVIVSPHLYLCASSSQIKIWLMIRNKKARQS